MFPEQKPNLIEKVKKQFQGNEQTISGISSIIDEVLCKCKENIQTYLHFLKVCKCPKSIICNETDCKCVEFKGCMKILRKADCTKQFLALPVSQISDEFQDKLLHFQLAFPTARNLFKKEQNTEKISEFLTMIEENSKLNESSEVKLFNLLILLKSLNNNEAFYFPRKVEVHDGNLNFKSNEIAHAFERIAAIFKNLNYGSAFYDWFSELDSKINHDVLNEKDAFEINSIDIETLKSHLLQLIPKYVMVYQSISLENGLFFDVASLAGFNYLKIFNERLDDVRTEIFPHRIIKIMLVGLHECASHAKIRNSNCFNTTPIQNEEETIISEDAGAEGESGSMIEQFITRCMWKIQTIKDDNLANQFVDNMNIWTGDLKDITVLLETFGGKINSRDKMSEKIMRAYSVGCCKCDDYFETSEEDPEEEEDYDCIPQLY